MFLIVCCGDDVMMSDDDVGWDDDDYEVFDLMCVGIRVVVIEDKFVDEDVEMVEEVVVCEVKVRVDV